MKHTQPGDKGDRHRVLTVCCTGTVLVLLTDSRSPGQQLVVTLPVGVLVSSFLPSPLFSFLLRCFSLGTLKYRLVTLADWADTVQHT